MADKVISLSSDSESGAEASTRPHSFANAKTVAIIVGRGSARKTYTVHKHILKEKCPYLAEQLAPAADGTSQKEVKLQRYEEPDTMDQFIGYLLTNTAASSEAMARSSKDVFQVLHAYALGEKFGMPNWQNLLINAMMTHWQNIYIDPEEVGWIIEHVHLKDPLYRLALDQLAFEASRRDCADTDEPEGTRKLYRDRLKALCTKEKFSPPRLIRDAFRFAESKDVSQPIKEGCVYHKHEPGEKCVKPKSEVFQEQADTPSRKRRKTNHR